MHIRFIYLFLLAGSLWQCRSENTQIGSAGEDTVRTEIPASDTLAPGSPTGESSRSNRIDCQGIGDILLTDTQAAIEKKIGKENLRVDSLFLEGMYQSMKLVAWPGTEKEIQLFWKEDKPPFTQMVSMSITQKNSPYQLANGLRIGSTLQELVAANGGTSITFYGFGWDYGGSISNFNRGKISQEYPCLSGVLNLDKMPDEKDGSKVYGDSEKHSDDPVFNNYPIYLSEIRIGKAD